MKTLGQNGLNFIANKLKELKESLKNYYTKEEADEAFVTPLFFADKLQEADMDLYWKCSDTMDNKINDFKATIEQSEPIPISKLQSFYDGSSGTM